MSPDEILSHVERLRTSAGKRLRVIVPFAGLDVGEELLCLCVTPKRIEVAVGRPKGYVVTFNVTPCDWLNVDVAPVAPSPAMPLCPIPETDDQAHRVTRDFFEMGTEHGWAWDFDKGWRRDGQNLDNAEYNLIPKNPAPEKPKPSTIDFFQTTDDPAALSAFRDAVYCVGDRKVSDMECSQGFIGGFFNEVEARARDALK